MIYGKIYFGVVLGTFTTSLANRDAPKMKYEEKLDCVEVNKDRFRIFQMNLFHLS